MIDPISQDILTAYLDGELTPDEQAVAERLLRDSQEHRQLLDDLRAVRSRMQALPIRVPDAALAERILEQAERIARQRRDAAVSVASPADDRKSGWFRVAVACLGLAASLLLMVVLFRGRGTELARVTRLARDTRDSALPAEPMAASSNGVADQTMIPDPLLAQPTAEHDDALVRSRAGEAPADRVAETVERYRLSDGTSPVRKGFAGRGTELQRQSATQDELQRRFSESRAETSGVEAETAAAARPATMPSAAKTAGSAPQSAAPAPAPQSAAALADKKQDRRDTDGAAALAASKPLADEPARLGSAGLGRGGSAGRGMLPPGAPAAAKGAEGADRAEAVDSAKSNRRQMAEVDPMFDRLDVRVVNVVPMRIAGVNRLASVEKLLQDNQIQLVQRDAKAGTAIGDAERLALREMKRNPSDPIDVYYIEGSAEQIQGLLRDLAGQPDLVHEIQPPRPLDVYRRGEPLSKLAAGDERAPRETPSDPAGAAPAAGAAAPAADSPQPLQEKLAQRGRALKLSNVDALEKSQTESNQTLFKGLSSEAGTYRLVLMIRTEPRKSGEVPRVEADNSPPR